MSTRSPPVPDGGGGPGGGGGSVPPADSRTDAKKVAARGDGGSLPTDCEGGLGPRRGTDPEAGSWFGSTMGRNRMHPYNYVQPVTYVIRKVVRQRLDAASGSSRWRRGSPP